MKCVADIVYDTDHSLSLDFYLPDTLTANACVLYVHGGNFVSGSRSDPEVLPLAQLFVDHGYGLAAIDLRANVEDEAFGPSDQTAISDAVARAQKIGLQIPAALSGPGYHGALEDVSKAMSYLQNDGDTLGIGSLRFGVLGFGSGGAVALGMAFAPRHMAERLLRPACVCALGGTLVQPWRIDADGPASLVFAATEDTRMRIEDVQFVGTRAQGVGADFKLIELPCDEPYRLLSGVLETSDAAGHPYRDILLDHFSLLID